jgi:hypothetical protein
MKEEWLSFTQFRDEYPEDRYHVIEIVTFEKGDIDVALQKITRICSRILKLDVEGDLVTLSNFTKRSETRIVRSKTRRKATMIAKYVRTYNLPDFPVSLVLAVEKDKVDEKRLEEIKRLIEDVLKEIKI